MSTQEVFLNFILPYKKDEQIWTNGRISFQVSLKLY